MKLGAEQALLDQILVPRAPWHHAGLSKDRHIVSGAGLSPQKLRASGAPWVGSAEGGCKMAPPESEAPTNVDSKQTNP